MATATKFMRFSWLFCSCYNFGLTNGTQFGNDSNYRKFNGENTAISCFVAAYLALGRLTNTCFGHHAILKIFSFRLPRELWCLRWISWRESPWREVQGVWIFLGEGRKEVRNEWMLKPSLQTAKFIYYQI